MSETDRPKNLPALGRRLLRQGGRAALATSLHGAPYASLVVFAADLDASPLLLLSDLARHSRNIAYDPRVSLLVDDAADLPDPLAGPRLSLIGHAEANGDPRSLMRFAARHPDSAAYAGFGDFRLYRIAVERGHLVAGFGRIAWIEGNDLLFSDDCAAFAAAEPAIVARLNKDRRETLARCAERLLRQGGDGWKATGVDPEGLDLRRGNAAVRLEFMVPVATPDMVPAALDQLLRQAAE